MQKKKQGISLIVLVITIIVMIILAAAIIISLQNNGIIGRASTAVKAYNEDEVSHMASLAWSEAYLNPAITTDEEYAAAVLGSLQNSGVDLSKYNITVTTSGVTVALKGNIVVGWEQDGESITKGDVTLEAGDLIQYNAGVQGYSGAWKVLGAEDGNLLIMSTEDVDSLTLYGFDGGTEGNTTYEYGLLNGIARLNEICEAYGNGTGAVGARSIKAEDVDKLTGYDKTTYGANAIHQYGNEVTYSWSTTQTGKVDYTSTNGTNGTLDDTFSNGFSYIDTNTWTKKTVLQGDNGLPTLTMNAYNYTITDRMYDPIDWTYTGTESLVSEKVTEMLGGNLYHPDKAPEEFYVYDASYWLADIVFTDNGIGYRSIGYGGNSAAGVEMRISLINFYTSFTWTSINGIRAVVKLSPNITIGTKDNTLGWSYTL